MAAAADKPTLAHGPQVWARNAFRKDALWPALLADAERDAPESVRLNAVPGRQCVMFFGPSSASTRLRDWYWRTKEDILPWKGGAFQPDLLLEQRVGARDRPAFQAAVHEAEEWFRAGRSVAAETSRQVLQPQQAKEEQLCNVCQKPRVQMASKMVACDRCNTWVHSHCDALTNVALEAARQSQACVYLCPSCRLSINQHKRTCLALEYEGRIRELRPTSQPETALGLIATEIGRKYQSQNLHVDLARIIGIADKMWRNMPPETRRIYEEQAKRLGENHSKKRLMYQAILVEFKKLMDFTRLPVPADLDIDTQHFTGLGVKRPPEMSLEGMRDQKQPCLSQSPMFLPRFDREHVPQWPPIGSQRNSAFSHFNPLRIKEEDCSFVHKERAQVMGASSSTDYKGTSAAGTVQKIPIICNGISGTFLLGLQRVICDCSSCAGSSQTCREFTATQFEQHCGAGSAKKWKASLRIRPGSLPEVPKGAAPLSLGKWFDMKGIDTKATKSASRVHSHPPLAVEAKVPEKSTVIKKIAKAKLRIDKKQEDVEPWRQVERGGYTRIRVNYAGDRCTACDSDVDYDCDQLITCDGCGMCVHQTCYGIPEAPKNDQIWLCAVCEARKRGEPTPHCCLCPIEGGAMKQTDIPGLWSHVACMQWIPEVTVRDPTKMEPIERINHIQKERWELTCSLCKQRMGAKIQCLQCYSTYHPLCARMAGLHMEMQEGRAGPAGPWRLVTYCPRHCKPRPELSGVHQIHQAKDKKNEQLFNSQPFKQPHAVKLPLCSSGAARTQPLIDWVRASHGTGAGFSSAKAFWIPNAPSKVCQVPSGGRETVRTSQKTQHVVLGHRNPSKQDKRPVSQVELVPLPEGVPETITVDCNGRRGTLIVRSQRVLCMDEETTASRFEQLCGKGEAKKWKCSLWHVDKNGGSPMQMQDWLNLMGLDRKVLSNLQANLAAYNLYHQYLDSQVEEVTQEMVKSVEARVAAAPAVNGECPPLDSMSEPDISSQRMDSSIAHSSDMSPSENFDSEETNLRISPGRGPGQDETCPSESFSQEILDEEAASLDAKSKDALSGLESTAAMRKGGGWMRNSTMESISSTVVNKDVLQQELGIPQFEDPTSCVGRACLIHWPDDEKWYSAVVKEHRQDTTEFRILYDIDQQEEWLDLQCEADEGRLEWISHKAVRRSISSQNAAGVSTRSNAKSENAMSGTIFPKLFRPDDSSAYEKGYHPSGNEAIGIRLSIWWADDSMYYPGVVIAYEKESGKHHIQYDDGDEEWLDVSKEHVVWDSSNWSQVEKDIDPPAADDEAHADESNPDLDIPPLDRPVNTKSQQSILIVCNRMEAEYKVNRMIVVLKDGSEMTPTEFERVAGKGASKKWKASIRVVNSKGNPGMSLGEWMINQGLDTPKVRVPRCMEKEPRRVSRRATLSIERKKPRHRQNCMCIICKQARRKGDTTSNRGTHRPAKEGIGGSRNTVVPPQSWRPATTTAAARAVGPRIRSEKRAYVEACPQLIRGPSTHSLLDIPESRHWTPERFLKERRSHQRNDPDPGDSMLAQGTLVDKLSNCKAIEGAQAQSHEANTILTKLETWRKQLKECQATEKERILFGKSGIHGWGLFARKRLKKDAMVIEYRGEVVGPAVADIREKMYKQQGKDCYLFHINEDHVIDATVNGAIGRFTNHSCAPSLYTKILFVDGKYHLCFFSRYDILPGQELTYDYRFKEETAENKIDCQCGAPNCRGSMN